jgi:hypothetical protein
MKQVTNYPVQAMIAEQMAEAQRKTFELDPNVEITPFGDLIMSCEKSGTLELKRAMELLHGKI